MWESRPIGQRGHDWSYNKHSCCCKPVCGAGLCPPDRAMCARAESSCNLGELAVFVQDTRVPVPGGSSWDS